MATAALCALAAQAGVPASRASPGSPEQGSALDVLRGEPADAQFARALAPRAFEFPQDHGPHPDVRHEWWYLTGRLRANDGEAFGFELTFFRLALAPPARGKPVSAQEASGTARSAWRARQIYVAHFALTDITGGTFHTSIRSAREALGLAGARASPFAVWLGPWVIAARAPAERPGAWPATATAGVLDWTLRAADESVSLALDLRGGEGPVLNGDRGLSVKAAEPGAASYYYSVPRIELAGTLRTHGRALAVSGLGWLDREWGSGALGARQVGWDWYALQLTDGSALMFYALRDNGGGRDPHSAGTFIAPDGLSRALASDQVRITVEDHWSSPRGGRYPSRWQLQVPVLGLELKVQPALADQELDVTPRYWEGAVDVRGTRGGEPVSGQGYVELVGYATPR